MSANKFAPLVEDGIDCATLVFPIRSPRRLFQRTALRKKLAINHFVFILYVCK